MSAVVSVDPRRDRRGRQASGLLRSGRAPTARPVPHSTSRKSTFGSPALAARPSSSARCQPSLHGWRGRLAVQRRQEQDPSLRRRLQPGEVRSGDQVHRRVRLLDDRALIARGFFFFFFFSQVGGDLIDAAERPGLTIRLKCTFTKQHHWLRPVKLGQQLVERRPSTFAEVF